MNIEKKVFQLIISAMFFVVPVFGQHSELLSQYRNRALQYNQDMKAAEKNIALSKELEKSAKTEYFPGGKFRSEFLLNFFRQLEGFDGISAQFKKVIFRIPYFSIQKLFP